MTRLRNLSQSDKQYQAESTLLAKVKEWLEPQEREGIKMLRICDRYAKGYSDLFLCVNGQFVVIELKDDRGVASEHQKLFIDEMRRAGAVGGICRSIRDVAQYIEEARKCIKT